MCFVFLTAAAPTALLASHPATSRGTIPAVPRPAAPRPRSRVMSADAADAKAADVDGDRLPITSGEMLLERIVAGADESYRTGKTVEL